MKRILTALILIPLIAYVALWAAQWLFLAVVIVVAGLCFYEYAGIAAGHGVRFPAWAGMVPGLGLLILEREQALVVSVIAVALLAAALRKERLVECLPEAAALLLGVVYVFGCWRSALGLRSINPYWLLFALSINWVGDSAAYYVGRAIGKHKMAPRISPAKSWEGAASSVVASVVYGVLLLHHLLPQEPVWLVALGAAAGNVAGQVGDLAESAMKRGAGIKDSGSLLPGHGGWLDRVDSTLFALPVVHLLLLVR
jgi:phosphatidate cytidylyltransferase